jgi:hypothetical protein
MRFACLLLLALPLAAQPPFPTTTLAVAISADDPSPIVLTSAAAANAPSLPIYNNGGPPIGYAQTIILVDQEGMCVLEPPTPSGSVVVSRGCQGTLSANHSKGATAYVGAASWYLQYNPSGSCIAQEQPVLPRIVLNSGALFNCVGGNWVVQGYSVRPRHRAPWYTAPVRAVRWLFRSHKKRLAPIQAPPIAYQEIDVSRSYVVAR